MKIYIYDDIFLNSYEIPQTSKESFVINYNGEIITLEKIEDKWCLRSNTTIEINLNGGKQDLVTLEEYIIYNITLTAKNIQVKMMYLPIMENMDCISLNNLNEITIGATTTNTISYRENGVLNSHAKITKTESQTIISGEENAPIYVNGKKVQSKSLSLGDIININGLKIIWMDTYFKMNNPRNSVVINGITKSNLMFPNANEYSKITETERNIKLYDESNMFFHTPTQKTHINPVEIRIEPPPTPIKNESMPMIFTLGTSLVIIASTVTSVLSIFDEVKEDGYTFSIIMQLIVAGLSFFACVLMPIITDKWQNASIKKKEKIRQKRYTDYLNKKQQEINSNIKTQEDVLREKFLPLEEISKQFTNRGYAFWSKEIIDSDFLTVRLGIGNFKASINIVTAEEGFTMEDDDLRDKVKELKDTNNKLKDVPIYLSLLENRVTPIVNESTSYFEYINSIMLQLMFYYSPIDLKIAVFTSKKNEEKWDYLKYTSYIWDDERDKRLFATNEIEAGNLSMTLEHIYNERVTKANTFNPDGNTEVKDNTESYKLFNDYYLIITDEYSLIKNLSILNKVINSSVNYGFSILVFSKSIKNIPSRLQKFVVIRNEVSGLFDKNVTDGTNIPFKAEIFPNSMIPYSNIVSNIPVSSKELNSVIPSSLGFLEMFNVGKVEHLNVTTRWKENDPTTSLNAPLGVQENHKLIGLDLHEKTHGPHGLIAGSTGSGKSEFIITLILSLAVNYHPYEVQFVLIDYKGGGLAGAFERREKGIKIPHLVGTITNLDKSEMNRTLVSIKSEMERRQRKFNEARDALSEGNIDIYKYQRLYREGKVSEPMSHLIIISDEFAELKQQQPEFMDELVSTARIGRSLGVHLILATQKPAGIVNDQIWSNSRFKICLKVQTTEDSVEVLKRDEASRIKETGRFILQVGNDELFEIGQSAWSGEKYVPKDFVMTKVNDSINFINNDGTIIKTVGDATVVNDTTNYGEELQNVVDYLYETAVQNNIQFNSLWLPSIPDSIYLGNLLKKYTYKVEKFKYNAIIGEYDKPAKQEQGLFTIDVTNNNTVVFGATGSGKENLVTTVLYSLCITHPLDELNVYIMDFGSETLRQFENMPHVGDFIGSDEVNKVGALFMYLEKQIKKRKELFSDYRGNFEYFNQNSPVKAPLILTIINAFEAFMETCGDYVDYLTHLLREGSKYGIVFMTTVVSTNSMRSSILEYFNTKMVLKVNDAFDYQYILEAPGGLVPSNYFGRGIGIVDDEACEFQTAYINLKDKINDTIKNSSLKYAELFKRKAMPIKIMPKSSTFDDLVRYSKELTGIPLGYDMETADLFKYNFLKNKITLISGPEILENINVLGTIIDLIDAVKNVKVNIFDFSSSISFEGNATYYDSGYSNVFNSILTTPASVPTLNIMLGFGSTKSLLQEDEFNLLKNIILNSNNLNNQYFVLVENVDNFNTFDDEDIMNVLDKTSGIWIGRNIDIQDFFDLDIRQADLENKTYNKTFIIENRNIKTLMGVGVTGDDN
jgi:S-DNA-T family DNA segregation ATPase FtsK/SpoIIIE